MVLLAATGNGARRSRDPCASPANAIVAENCKQGVSSDIWDVNSAGSRASAGFRRGVGAPSETIEFKIKLQFGEALKRVDIFRLGYYGGRRARHGQGDARPARLTHSDRHAEKAWPTPAQVARRRVRR